MGYKTTRSKKLNGNFISGKTSGGKNVLFLACFKTGSYQLEKKER